MNPRLKSSKKWTSFPTEYTKQIKEVFEQGFKEQLTNSQLLIEGRIYQQEILLRVGVLEKGALKQANFEVSMDLDTKKKNTVDQLHNCIDAAASMIQEYFEDRDKSEDEEGPDFPYSWQEYDFNGQKIYFQFSTENSDLEAKANALLGESDEDSLVHEEVDEDDEEDSDDSSGKTPTRH